MHGAFTQRDLEKNEGYDEYWGVDKEELVCVEMHQAGSTLVTPITGCSPFLPNLIRTELRELLSDGESGSSVEIQKTVRNRGDLIDMPQFRGW